MNTKFTATFLTDQGGSAGFYKIKESKTIGFKEFNSKKTALFAYNTQKKLAKLGLAPKVYGKVCKIKIDCYGYLESTGWGFLTQIVKIRKQLSRKKIQNLVDNIRQKTRLSFWDCHEYNIGIYRNTYVCIDTGKESFDSLSDAWGMGTPGPFCSECNKYTCKCDWNF
jgi:hypothetical protein